MNISTLKRFAPRGRSSILDGLSRYWYLLDEFGINTPNRIAHFLAQIAHESDGFHTSVEYASGAAYEDRLDLGNISPGDGPRFKGRGLIQVTGRRNYQRFQEWCERRFKNCPNFFHNPERLALFPWALLSALWYWSSRDLNNLADRDNIREITKAVNGGLNGLADRIAWLDRARRYLQPQPIMQAISWLPRWLRGKHG